VFFGGILNGATCKLSRTGSTIAVRPLAPRQPGRDDANASTAGSRWSSTRSGFLSPLPVWAIRRTLSPNAVITAVGLLCCGGDAVVIPRPWAYSAGLTCGGLPVTLAVGSPVIASQRTSPLCWSEGCVVARRSRDWVSLRAASDCFRRARRIIGMLERECWPSTDPWKVPPVREALLGAGTATCLSSSRGETSRFLCRLSVLNHIVSILRICKMIS
jgi:hypothetical protein